MDPVQNPFVPGAGNQPPELAGRQRLLTDIDVALQRIAAGRHSQSTILVGLRGVGKTVLLVRVAEMARLRQWRAYQMEAHEGRTLVELIAPALRSALYSLSAVAQAGDLARRAMRVLRGFLDGLKVRLHALDMSLTVEAEPGVADSGNLELDLPELFAAVGEAAEAAGHPVLLLIDELQYATTAEFSALIMALHRISQRNLPILLVGAGLPLIPALAGESKSYAERLFRFPAVGALELPDALDAIVKPARDAGVQLRPDALDEIMRLTQRYPYFLQQWGHDAWNAATGTVITLADVQEATPVAMATLDQAFFRVRFDRCSPSEKRYLRALAGLGPAPQRTGDVARALHLRTTSIGPTRDKLIRKGMIYAPQHGDVAFTVPLFDDYMRRVMPEL